MIFLTMFDVFLLIHEFIFFITLNCWIILFRFKFFKNPNPLFAYIITLVYNIGILGYMIYYDFPFNYILFYLIYIISKIISVNSLIFNYDGEINYFSIIFTIFLIVIITSISTITTINPNN